MSTRCWAASGLIVAIVGLLISPARAANESAVMTETAVYSGLVPADAYFAMHLYPRRVLSSRSLEKLGIGSLFDDMVRETDFSPLDLDQMVILMGPSAEANPNRRFREPKFAWIGRFSKPHDGAKMAAKWLERRKLEEFEIAGHKCYRAGKQPNGFGPTDAPNICFLDSRTFILATAPWLPDILSAKGATSTLISALAASNRGADGTIIFANTDAAKQMIAENFPANAAGPLPPLGPLVEQLQTAKLTAFTDPEISLKLTVIGKDDASAEQVAKAVKAFQQSCQALLAALKFAPADNLPPDQRDARELALNLAKKLVDGIVPHQSGQQVTVEVGNICSVDTLVGKLILPATAAQRLATQRHMRMNNLRQISLSMLSAESAAGQFPAHAIYSKEGKPLLSWRVALLPSLGQDELYKQFHLDEPWDSEHNKPLITKMPPVYWSSNKLQLVDGKTTYVVPVGKDTIFDGDKGITMANISDGASKTILALQVGDDKAVTWTKPDDMEFDPKKPLAGLGMLDDLGIQAAFADGHVQYLRKNIDAETFRRLILRNDGEVVDQSKL